MDKHGSDGVLRPMIKGGDASMLLTKEQLAVTTPTRTQTESQFSENYQRDISASLGTDHVARGRLGFGQPPGTLRTKPGRLDSLPSTSHSCADKLARWNVVGLQGALGSSIFEPMYVSGYVFGVHELPPHLSLQKLHKDVVRALVERVEEHLRELSKHIHFCPIAS